MIVSRPLSATSFGTAVCGALDTVGDLVYISGPKVGGDYSVSRADPSDPLKFPAVGVITAKLSATRAVIQFGGEIRGIYTGLTPGKVYWVDPAGLPTDIPPSPSLGGTMRLQSIGVAMDSDVLRFEPLKVATVRTA